MNNGAVHTNWACFLLIPLHLDLLLTLLRYQGTEAGCAELCRNSPIVPIPVVALKCARAMASCADKCRSVTESYEI